MRALRLDSGRLSIATLDRPRLPDGEARVKVRLAGICSTDLQLKAGYMGFQGTPGHEFVGEVIEAPSRPELAGKRVAGEINAGCGRCDDERHCTQRTVLGILGRDGAFAEELLLPVRNLHEIPDGIADERAVFIEPVAAAFRIREQMDVTGLRALVMGAGKLGSLCARVLRADGAEVSVLARPASAALLARDAFPVLAPDHEGKYDLVVEATGSPEGFTKAMGLVRPRGTLVLKSTCASGVPLNLAPVVIDEITVMGSRCGPFAPAVEALRNGELAPEETVAGTFALEEFEKAFAAAERPEDPARRKVLIRP